VEEDAHHNFRGGWFMESRYFYAPTVIANVQEGVRVVDEEQFGPVMPIITCVLGCVVCGWTSHFRSWCSFDCDMCVRARCVA
jgi:hypothetical protein